jgi:hypothetical protein
VAIWPEAKWPLLIARQRSLEKEPDFIEDEPHETVFVIKLTSIRNGRISGCSLTLIIQSNAGIVIALAG